MEQGEDNTPWERIKRFSASGFGKGIIYTALIVVGVMTLVAGAMGTGDIGNLRVDGSLMTTFQDGAIEGMKKAGEFLSSSIMGWATLLVGGAAGSYNESKNNASSRGESMFSQIKDRIPGLSRSKAKGKAQDKERSEFQEPLITETRVAEVERQQYDDRKDQMDADRAEMQRMMRRMDEQLQRNEGRTPNNTNNNDNRLFDDNTGDRIDPREEKKRNGWFKKRDDKFNDTQSDAYDNRQYDNRQYDNRRYETTPPVDASDNRQYDNRRYEAPSETVINNTTGDDVGGRKQRYGKDKGDFFEFKPEQSSAPADPFVPAPQIVPAPQKPDYNIVQASQNVDSSPSPSPAPSAPAPSAPVAQPSFVAAPERSEPRPESIFVPDTAVKERSFVSAELERRSSPDTSIGNSL
jgi:hypothetical protein